MLALIEHRVAATLQATDRGAAIAVGVIAVVAGLRVVAERAQDTVAATRPQTAVGAAGRVDEIAIIALLALVEVVVAAALDGASGRAAVAVDIIAIVIQQFQLSFEFFNSSPRY